MSSLIISSLTYADNLNNSLPLLPEPLIQHALQVHPAIFASEHELEAARLEKKATQHQVYPSLSAQAQFTREGQTSKIVLEQPLWTGGRLTALQQKSFFNHRIAFDNLQAQRYELTSRVLETWGLLLDAYERSRVAQQTLSELEGFATMMRRRVDSGISARFELDLVESRILQSRVTRDSSDKLLELGLNRLAQLLAKPSLAKTQVQWPDVVALSTQVSQDYQTQTTTPSREWGQSHPLVKQTRDLAAAMTEEANIARASRYPQISVGYEYDYQHFLHQDSLNQQEGQLRLSVQYTMGAGRSTVLTERSLRAKALSLEQKTMATHQQIVDQIDQQLYNFLSAQARVETLKAAMQSARLVQESYQRQFLVGRRSWLELMNATREIEQNAYDLVATRTALILNYYQLQLLTGQLEPLLNSDLGRVNEDSVITPTSLSR
ncbi:TolC family protein [Agitococcus lubricus]|uniref:TolC family protein n=1 Tax=Agitococcus lubricus TaxID=1077255 RepID=UPI0011B27DE0|nr:TolC family protein [Agitococcus lubricus]